MRKISRLKFEKYKNAEIKIEIQSITPERFINLIWKNDIYAKNIIRKSITTILMNIRLEDYGKINKIARKNNVKLRIIKRWGISFFILKLKRNRMLVLGIFLFIGIICYLSTFIWEIKINSDANLPPYELRQKLKEYGVVPGISKKKLNVYSVEEFLIKSDENIMWVKARIEGSRLIITATERKSPPNIVLDNSPCDLAAAKDGEVLRVYTTAGTSVVNRGDMVKKGQILVKGIQGKEGESYTVHASGDVICKTFYEKSKEVKIDSTKRERTGKKIENYYLNINGKKVYLKKNINKFDKYDKIEESKLFLKKETFYEVKEVKVKGNVEKMASDIAEELYTQIYSNLDKSVKILDKVVDKKQDKVLKVRVLVIAEENIVSQIEHKDDVKEENSKNSNN